MKSDLKQVRELKPCPFCGIPDRLYMNPAHNNPGREAWVSCRACDASGKMCVASAGKTAEEWAAEFWNTRAPLDWLIAEEVDADIQYSPEYLRENAFLRFWERAQDDLPKDYPGSYAVGVNAAVMYVYETLKPYLRSPDGGEVKGNAYLKAVRIYADKWAYQSSQYSASIDGFKAGWQARAAASDDREGK